MKTWKKRVWAVVCIVVAICNSSLVAQRYRSSVVGTDFDFITEADPSAFHCLEFKGRGAREMPDKRGPSELIQEAFIFVSYFKDGTSVDMAFSVDFESEEKARIEALRFVPRLGRLPTALRQGVKRLVVHKGGRDTTAFSDVGLIVMYSENATKRISTHDLEETIFHESVHAAWDKEHRNSKPWLDAQKKDGGFITNYAKRKPGGEDLAESALFAFTLIHHPERIPKAEADAIRKAIPNRIAFVKTLVPPGKPLQFEVGPQYACDGSGTTFQKSMPKRSPQKASSKTSCSVKIQSAVSVKDILSNALYRGMDVPESAAKEFLKQSYRQHRSARSLVVATAKHFKLDEKELIKTVREFYHCNCHHDDLGDDPATRAPSLSASDEPSTDPTPSDLKTQKEADNAGLSTIIYLLYGILAVLLGILAALGLLVSKFGKSQKP